MEPESSSQRETRCPRTGRGSRPMSKDRGEQYKKQGEGFHATIGRVGDDALVGKNQRNPQKEHPATPKPGERVADLGEKECQGCRCHDAWQSGRQQADPSTLKPNTEQHRVVGHVPAPRMLRTREPRQLGTAESPTVCPVDSGQGVQGLVFPWRSHAHESLTLPNDPKEAKNREDQGVTNLHPPKVTGASRPWQGAVRNTGLWVSSTGMTGVRLACFKGAGLRPPPWVLRLPSAWATPSSDES